LEEQKRNKKKGEKVLSKRIADEQEYNKGIKEEGW
jgi:hypothetical protein